MYTQLLDYCDGWFSQKPSSFTPMYFREWDNENVLPEIWMLSGEGATGLQYYYLTRILLAAHNPKIPRLGPGRVAALRAMDEEIKHHVRLLCGMAICNERVSPSFETASMAIAMAGEKFTERNEREALLNILLRTEKEHAWPTGIAQKELKEAWGWVGG